MNPINTEQRTIRRGDIYYIVDDPNKPSIGSEIWPNRAGIVVSNDWTNESSNAIQIVYLSTSSRKKISPTHVPVMSGNKKAIALCEQIHTVDISRLKGKFGHISDDEMANIEGAIMFLLYIKPGKSPRGRYAKWERYAQDLRKHQDIIEKLIAEKPIKPEASEYVQRFMQTMQNPELYENVLINAERSE